MNIIIIKITSQAEARLELYILLTYGELYRLNHNKLRLLPQASGCNKQYITSLYHHFTSQAAVTSVILVSRAYGASATDCQWVRVAAHLASNPAICVNVKFESLNVPLIKH